MTSLASVLCAVVLVACSAMAETPWAAMAARDARAIHDVILANHPGPVDPENPAFRERLERGLRAATAEAAHATTYSDYVRTLRRYTNSFEDGHITVSFDIAPQKTEWPGFIVRGNADGRIEVAYAEANAGVKEGDVIERCDDRTIDALLKERNDPFYWNRAIPHARLNFVAYLFTANPDEHGRELHACHLASGADVPLVWRSIDSCDFTKLLIRASIGDAEFSMAQADGIWFVRLPRFWFASDAEMQKLSGIVDRIRNDAAELRKSTVVLDVRGNGGGDSLWGYRVAAALWGDDWASAVEGSFDNTHDVRASPANIRKVVDIIARMKKNGEAEAIPYWQEVLEKMQAARKSGKALARIDLPPSTPQPAPPPNPISGRVFLLTDNACGSACLDFADLVLRLPGMTQIGLPTFADTVYIDANEAPLPSGMARLSYGMKVFRNRVRKNNEWYEPKYRWPGGAMTNEAIAKWIRTLPADAPQGGRTH